MTMIKNVHGNTLDWLGEAILTGHYPVGSSLPPEPVLCEELGVSRTVVREAIKSLVAKPQTNSHCGSSKAKRPMPNGPMPTTLNAFLKRSRA